MPSASLRAWESLALYLVLAAAALFPVLAVPFPPLADLANHLARAFIIADLPSDPDLQRHYALQWQLISFQSSDLLLPPLTKLVGVEAAGKLFIAATFAALLGGVFALHKVLFGRVGLWPALAFLPLYNFMFAWGFLSFLFTSGLALMVLATWIATAEREGVLRSTLFAIAALALFFFHFFAFAIFALTVLGFELGRWWHDRRRLIRRMLLSGAVFVGPAILFLLAPRNAFPIGNGYGGTTDKIRAIISPFNMYFGTLDFALCLAAVALFWIGFRTRRVLLAAPMRWPLGAAVAAAILMPNLLMSVWGTDFRMPTICMLLLIGGTDCSFRTRQSALTFAVLAAAVLLVRVGTVTAEWRRIAADFSEFRAAIATLDRGSRVVVAQSLQDHRDPPAVSLFPYRHVAALAVIDRKVFLPHLFSVSTPLRFVSPGGNWTSDQLAVLRKPEWQRKTPEFAAADAKTIDAVERVQKAVQDFDQATSTIDWSDWPEQFDYLIDFSYGLQENPVPALLTEIHRGSYFAIFRIHPPKP